jgi:hypothetical protein
VRPIELSGFQPLIIKPEAVVIPFYDLDFISLTVAEDKTGILHGAKVKFFLDYSGQTTY